MGSPELHNGGLRALDEASEGVFACDIAGYPIISGGFLCINGFFLGSQATVVELLASPEVEGSPELQNGGRRAPGDARKHRFVCEMAGQSCQVRRLSVLLCVQTASSRALRPPLWSSRLPLTSRDLLRRSLTHLRA